MSAIAPPAGNGSAMHGLSDLVPAWGRRYASGLVKFKAAVVPLEINKQQQFSYLGSLLSR